MISLLTILFGVLTPVVRIFPWTNGQQLQIRYPGTQWMTPGIELDIKGTSMAKELNRTV